MIATELLDTLLDPTPDPAVPLQEEIPMPPSPRPRHAEVDDDELVDEPFRAAIARSSYSPPTMSEGDVVKECSAWLAVQERCAFHKVHGNAQVTGEPDYDIVWRGRAVKIEAKARGAGAKYRPTRAQHRRLLEYQEAGALVGCVQGLDDLIDILDRVDDPTYRYHGQIGTGRA